jgi:hypothetical protein
MAIAADGRLVDGRYRPGALSGIRRVRRGWAGQDAVLGWLVAVKLLRADPQVLTQLRIEAKRRRAARRSPVGHAVRMASSVFPKVAGVALIWPLHVAGCFVSLVSEWPDRDAE